MTLSASASAPALKSRPSAPHLHGVGESCPLCDQPIPRDRYEEIKERIEIRRREERLEIEARYDERLALEKAEAVEQARAEARTALDREKQQFQVREAAAREDGRRGAEAAARETLAQLQARVAEVEAGKAQSESALMLQLEEARCEKETAVQKVKEEANAKQEEIREEAERQALASVQETISGIQRDRQESEEKLLARAKAAEEAKSVSDESLAALRTQVEEVRAAGEEQVEKAKRDADERVKAAGMQATAAAEVAMQGKVSAAVQAKTEAETKAAAAEQKVRSLQEQHQADTTRQLHEQREILERDKETALNAEKSAAFDKELRLSNKVEELQRALANKTAEELGEGAEIDLFETLKEQFKGDRIERIGKGQPGADILHTVIHKGQECGGIIYDSKNHNAWRSDFVTKLAEDQVAAKADHAILSTRKFPKGTRELHVQEGVIVAAPSRVATVAQIVRQYIVTGHAMRLSNQERAQKTAELYSFINSGRCRDLFKRIDANADKLLDLQVKEKKAHDTMWKNQGEIIRSIQKTQAEITNEIDLIVGTAEMPDEAANE